MPLIKPIQARLCYEWKKSGRPSRSEEGRSAWQLGLLSSVFIQYNKYAFFSGEYSVHVYKKTAQINLPITQNQMPLGLLQYTICLKKRFYETSNLGIVAIQIIIQTQVSLISAVS